MDTVPPLRQLLMRPVARRVHDLYDFAHDFAHELMAEDVTRLHRGDATGVQVQVAAADRRGRHAEDAILGIDDTGIGDVIDANIFFSMPGDSFHR